MKRAIAAIAVGLAWIVGWVPFVLALLALGDFVHRRWLSGTVVGVCAAVAYVVLKGAARPFEKVVDSWLGHPGEPQAGALSKTDRNSAK